MLGSLEIDAEGKGWLASRRPTPQPPFGERLDRKSGGTTSRSFEGEVECDFLVHFMNGIGERLLLRLQTPHDHTGGCAARVGLAWPPRLGKCHQLLGGAGFSSSRTRWLVGPSCEPTSWKVIGAYGSSPNRTRATVDHRAGHPLVPERSDFLDGDVPAADRVAAFPRPAPRLSTLKQ